MECPIVLFIILGAGLLFAVGALVYAISAVIDNTREEKTRVLLWRVRLEVETALARAEALKKGPKSKVIKRKRGK